MTQSPMNRWSICLCAVLLAAACTSDGGPGTESPNGGTGGVGAGAGGAGGTSGTAGTGDAATGGAGAGGVAGVSGEGGSAGLSGAGGMASGQGGAGGTVGEDAGGGMGGSMTDDDGGAVDEGYCTVACTGIAPDENVAEACGMITSLDDCTMFETGGFPASCRWVTPDSEPCLAP